MLLALYQPDIPQNTGTLARLCRCLGLELHIIEPAGFTLEHKDFRRAGLDYADAASVKRHDDWAAFLQFCKENERRIILLSTKAQRSYLEFEFSKQDVLLFGRESAGAPDFVHDAAFERLRIPLVDDMRSLNLATAAAMVAGEALRQTKLTA